jgi:predicted ATP-dependent endonuclease of OLD family
MPKHLQNIKITNYRGFYETEKIVLAIPNGKEGSGLTVVVGPNNSGKTTVFEALKKFCSDGLIQFDKEERHPNKIVTLTLENSNHEVKEIHTTDGALGTVVGEELYPQKKDFFLISSRRYFETYFHTDKMSHETHRDSLLRLTKSGSDGDFGRRMNEISSNSSLKAEFDTILKRLIPHFSSWRIELTRGQNYISYITGSSDEHSSELFGDGIISLFKIVAALVTGADDEILLIDEPELSLHPQAQKALSIIVSEASAKRQIVITTHSPLFINWCDVENGAVVNRLNKIKDKKCTVSIIDDDVKKNLLKYVEDWRKPQLLDAVAKEVFFAEKIVFVEGLEDMSLITRFLKQNGITIDFEFFGYGSGGAANIPTLLKMSENLGIKSGAIFDGKEVELIAKAKLASPNALIENISTDDIRDKAEKLIIGMFTESGKMKSEFEAELKGIIQRLNGFFNS